ncbi:Serine/threonine-protein kinase PRP4-like [Symbiodinium microadriaticum]|uniref:Serine/threonine-protein kinase PRP4-like n=1 Tax=Symbiodinium microadriaticum TaxID=2951 RepID=A0A1Q9F1H4_SYMMI|nr:Serine/threonine-protein kinase PRP4-like [Symbiodinium microadriaticum]
MFDETADEDAIRKAATGQANAISQTGASADDWDDSEGCWLAGWLAGWACGWVGGLVGERVGRYYKAKIGEVMMERYEVTEDFVGKGVFSNVCKAKTDGSMVAIKVMRCNDMMKKAAEKEVEILERINKADKQNKRCMWDNLRVALKKRGTDVLENTSPCPAEDDEEMTVVGAQVPRSIESVIPVEPTPYLVSRFYRAPEIVLAAK